VFQVIKKKVPETVLEMWIGEILLGILVEAIGLIFVKDRLNFTIGLVCGVLLSIAGIYHMWWAIDRSLDMNEKKAGRFVGTQYGIRYACLIMLVAILYVTGWGNAFAAFGGYIIMKLAAYIQPFIHKVLRR